MPNEPSHFRRIARASVALSLAALLLSGCYHVRSGTNDTAGVEHSQWSHFFFFGIIGKEEINASDICPNGVARVHTYLTFVNGLVTILPGLFGLIWSPRTVEITCAGGGGAALELDGEGNATAVQVTNPQGASQRRELDAPIAYTGPSEVAANEANEANATPARASEGGQP
jgi:hypothetical protein